MLSAVSSPYTSANSTVAQMWALPLATIFAAITEAYVSSTQCRASSQSCVSEWVSGSLSDFIRDQIETTLIEHKLHASSLTMYVHHQDISLAIFSSSEYQYQRSCYNYQSINLCNRFIH